MVSKKSIFFATFFMVVLLLSHYQSYSSEFSLADSLFAQRKYSKALEAYEALYQNDQFSAAMLLKLSYMHERVGRFEEALYYLSVYQQYFFSQEVQRKIDALAQEHQLSGYASNDNERIFIFYQQYKSALVLGLLLICTMVFSILVYQRQKLKMRPVALGIVFTLLSVAVGVVANYVEVSPKAIIRKSDTMLMEGPSAASNRVDVLQKGHRVSILEENEAWTKILWDGEPAYLRKDKLRKI